MNKNQKQQFIIFGASGDLAYLKLFPALFELYRQKKIVNFDIIGFARSQISQKKFQAIVKKSVSEYLKKKYLSKKVDQNLLILLNKFVENVSYFQGEYANSDDYLNLVKSINIGNNLITYLAVPTAVFEPILINIKKYLPQSKLMIEKPFGNDYKSAKALLKLLRNNCLKDQIFLIDHYLGKKEIQSILHLKQDSIIDNQLKPERISKIEIVALEKVDVKNRLGYFDKMGAINDMIQSHLLQIAALICADINGLFDKNQNKFNFDQFAKQKNKILKNLAFKKQRKDLLIGQYQHYRKEVELINKKSQTETLAFLRLYLKNKIWSRIPIELKTAKAWGEDLNYVSIELKKAKTKAAQVVKLIFKLKPESYLTIELLENGEIIQINKSLECEKDFCLEDYASLIYSAMINKRDFFLSENEILSSWKLIDNVKSYIEQENIKPKIYQNGIKNLSF